MDRVEWPPEDDVMFLEYVLEVGSRRGETFLPDETFTM